jgi:putative colanic acid biosynthesis UDP-glucose lipid carrier transferase
MFRIEKIFQNDDSLIISFDTIAKYIVAYLTCYVAIILTNNSIYELLEIKIFTSSVLFNFTNYFIFFYIICNFFVKKKTIYNRSVINFISQEFIKIIIVFVPLTIFFYITGNNDEYFIFYISLLIFIIINLWILKIFINKIYYVLIHNNHIQRNVILFGNSNELEKLIKNFINEDINIFKCVILANVQDKSSYIGQFNVPIINESADLLEIIAYHRISELWIVADKLENQEINIKIEIFSKLPINIKLISSNKIFNKLCACEYFNHYFHYAISVSKFHGNTLFIKLLSDKILGIFFLIILSPILILVMIIIFLEDGLPVFFIQERTGWDGRRFKILKLRTLKQFEFDKSKQVLQGDDIRLLKCGDFIRRLSIDEIPQFFNVLKGEMSIVGPRPHMTEHSYKYSKILSGFLKRHKCNPGITGLAQVEGMRGSTSNIEDMESRMKLDIQYIENWSLWLDCKIILKTFYAVFKHRKL